MKRRFRIPLALKLSTTFALLFMTIVVLILYSVQQIVTHQFTERYYRDVGFAVESLDNKLSSRRDLIRAHLRQLAVKISGDNDFRLYVNVLEEYSHPTVVDYAPEYMPTMRLDVLKITTNRGVVLSSGHFRNSFGKDAGSLIRGLRSAGAGPVLYRYQIPAGSLLCLSAIDSVRIGAQYYYLIGGLELNNEYLAGLRYRENDRLMLHSGGTIMLEAGSEPGDEILRALISDQETVPDTGAAATFADEYTFANIPLAVITGRGIRDASLTYLHSRHELIELIDSLNKRIIMIGVLGITVTVLLSFWRSYSVTGPLQKLAAVAENISLLENDDPFVIRSRDEVGILNNALQDMVRRLRKSGMDLAAAEQKAAFADLARKVNHDIKNGFIPIRNVMQHWAEAAESDPEELLRVFNERKSTVMESLEYLGELAREYSRIRRQSDVHPVNLNALIEGLTKTYTDGTPGGIDIATELPSPDACILADELQIRRALDNLLRNAVESLATGGNITVRMFTGSGAVKIEISDTGTGISPSIQEKLFLASVTTKSAGTGIGLLNVKHICEMYGGTITLVSEEGKGTDVFLSFPAYTSAMQKNISTEPETGKQ